jgi:putative membrane protein insertion efficiency factor
VGLGGSGEVRARDVGAARGEDRAGSVAGPATLTAAVLRGLVRGYQILLSPMFPPSCRFHPSCSDYALEALERHGPSRGTWLATRRIARCHPWCPGGHDPVP